MKTLGIIFLFLGFAILMALGIVTATGLSLPVAAGISLAACILVYLMMDLRPEQNAGDATIIRLTKSSWHKKKK